MAKENSDRIPAQRLQQLIAEVDASRVGQQTSTSSSADQAVANWFFLLTRWTVFGLCCLGVGFWVGTRNAQLRWALQSPSEEQLLVSQGWRHDQTGVFYRWCQENCHAPQMYGGGLIKAFEVKCVQRPCGQLLMNFNVLNTKGEIIDTISIKEMGLQGETRRFLIETQSLVTHCPRSTIFLS